MLQGTSINEAFNEESLLNDIPIPNNTPDIPKKNESYNPPYNYDGSMETRQPYKNYSSKPNKDKLIETTTTVDLEDFNILKKELEILKEHLKYNNKDIENNNEHYTEHTEHTEHNNNNNNNDNDNDNNNNNNNNNENNIEQEPTEYNRGNEKMKEYSNKINNMEIELMELHKYNKRIKNKMEEYKNYYSNTKNNLNKNNIEHFGGVSDAIEDNLMSKNFHDILLFIIFGIFVILLLDTLFRMRFELRK